MNGSLLDENPIAVPSNPFWKVLKTFGRDEFIAGLLSVAVTAAAEAVFYFLKMPKTGVALLVLAFIGPIFEKFGFFIGHIKDSYEVYRTTREVDRKPYSHYAKVAFKGGSKSLIQDILVHDPIYVGLMLGGMWIHPSTPAWLLVPVAFAVAVLLVAFGEVSFTELRYRLFQHRLFKLGFRAEKYLEARFYVALPSDSMEKAVERLADDLKRQCFDYRNFDENIFTYTDYYYKPDLSNYNARTPKIRLRERSSKNKQFNSLQVVYTRAVEETESAPEQYRFFPQRKDKFYLPLSEEDLSSCTNIKDEALRLYFRKITTSNSPVKKIKFSRQAFYSPKSMFVAIDTIEDQETPFVVIEFKVYQEKQKLLKEAMRFIMHKYKVVQTTHGKSELL